MDGCHGMTSNASILKKHEHFVVLRLCVGVWSSSSLKTCASVLVTEAPYAPLTDCEISDDVLGDCCRETGDDWELTNLNVKAKVALFRFLCDQSLKTGVLR